LRIPHAFVIRLQPADVTTLGSTSSIWLGADYYERQAGVRRQIARHAGKLGALGFEVTLCRIPDPDPAGQPQAA
jgi:hypothetical protein